MNSRKILYLFFGVVFVFVIFVVIPFLLISLNTYFNLPVYTNIYVKSIGIFFLLFGFSVIAYSTILHMKTGRVTPLPVVEKPKKFIVYGLYKYSRNPMYTAEIFLLFGLFFFLGYALLLLFPFIFFVCAYVLVVYIEEPELRRIFGKEYIQYTKRVSRWLPECWNKK